MEKREIKHFTYFGRLQVWDPIIKKKHPKTPPFSPPVFLPVHSPGLQSLHDIIREEGNEGEESLWLLAPFKVM